MSRFVDGMIAAAVVTVAFSGVTGARADDTTAPATGPVAAAAAPASTLSPDAAAIIDKAIAAIGGADKLSKVTAVTWKSTGTVTFGGDANSVSSAVTIQGMDHRRQDFSGTFGGNPVTGSIILAGDTGSRNFNDNPQDMDKDAVVSEKRNTYLLVIPITLVALKSKDYHVEMAVDPAPVTTVAATPPAAPAAPANGAAAAPATPPVPAAAAPPKALVGIKVTPPDGKAFSLYFDKDTGLPAKLVANVIGFDGNEFTQETAFSGYKVLGGILKATHLESRRDGAVFLTEQISDFQPLDKVDPKTFATQ